MELSFGNYIIQLSQNLPLFIITILILGVILVNGWTDAPNAIATCISTKSIHPKAGTSNRKWNRQESSWNNKLSYKRFSSTYRKRGHYYSFTSNRWCNRLHWFTVL